MRRLRRIRVLAGLTQEQLADATGISQPVISSIERGATTRTSVLDRLARVLGVSAAELIEEDPDEPAPAARR